MQKRRGNEESKVQGTGWGGAALQVDNRIGYKGVNTRERGLTKTEIGLHEEINAPANTYMGGGEGGGFRCDRRPGTVPLVTTAQGKQCAKSRNSATATQNGMRTIG